MNVLYYDITAFIGSEHKIFWLLKGDVIYNLQNNNGKASGILKSMLEKDKEY